MLVSYSHQRIINIYIYFSIFLVVLFFFSSSPPSSSSFFFYNRCSLAPLSIRRDVVVVEKAGKKGDRENNARPETAQTSCTCFTSLLFSNITTSALLHVLYHLTGNKEKKKKRERERRRSLCLSFFFSLYSNRSFSLFFSLLRRRRRGTEIFCILLLRSFFSNNRMSLLSMFLFNLYLKKDEEK